MWIEVLVEKHYHAGSREINTHATCLGGQQEHRDGFIFVKLIHKGLPDVDSSRSSKDKEFCVPLFENSLQNIEYLRKLEPKIV